MYLHCILMYTSSPIDIMNHDLDVFVIEDFANYIITYNNMSNNIVF